MKAYKFRLAAVERVRRVEEAARKAEYIRATAEVASAARAAARAADAYASRSAPAKVTGDEAEATWEQGQRQAVMVTEAEQVRVAAEAEAEKARQAWVAANRARRVLERLDERHRERWRQEFERWERAELDDVTSARAAVSSRADHDSAAGAESP